MADRKLETRSIGDVVEQNATYHIPSYQRGYRWGENEVERLLEDVWEAHEKKKDDYYLQPIVVRNKGNNEYELIDGQQRLTTIYLI